MMLEGTIKLHGEQGCGKTQLLREIEEVLRNPKYANLKITCRTQQPGQPAEVEAVFKKGPRGASLNSNWNDR